MAMTYKKKAAVLSAFVVVLAAVYILSLVFDPGNKRDHAFAWLEPSLLVMADGIEIYGPEGRSVLKRKNDIWFFQAEGSDYHPAGRLAFDQPALEFPVKQERVGDLFALLGRREVYPVRASSSEGIQRLGLTEDSASRIIVRGGAGLPLLDLLVGSADALGREIFLRRTGWNKIYSAEDHFSFFTGAKPRSWYDLRMFPQFAADSVQQAEIIYPNREAYILRRSGGRWIIPGSENAPVDTIRVEAWLRMVLEAEGDDFGFGVPEEAEGSITFWFGDGSTQVLRLGFADEQNNRRAVISGSSFVYVLTERKFNNLFRESSYFFE